VAGPVPILGCHARRRGFASENGRLGESMLEALELKMNLSRPAVYEGHQHAILIVPAGSHRVGGRHM